MSFLCKATRYGHSEGHTDVCYTDNASHLITCGSDGDLRIWKGMDDDDPVSYHAGDAVNTVIYQDNRIFTGGEDQAVLIHDFKDGSPEGSLTRFTANVNHIVLNRKKTLVYAGASDFNIKIVDISSRAERILRGHTAPILSLAVHPSDAYLASASCDGSVRIWNLEEDRQIKSFQVIPKSNDFSLSQTLCRLQWSIDGMFVFIPVDKEVHVYRTDKWNEAAFTLKPSKENMKQPLNVLSLSPCGKYLSGAYRDGTVLVWNLKTKKCVNEDQHDKKLNITSLVWDPRNNGEMAFCDDQGNVGLFEGVLPIASNEKTEEESEKTENFDDLFGDGDDDLMAELEGGGEGLAQDPIIDDNDDDDDDGDAINISKIKRANQLEFEDEETKDSVLSAKDEKIMPAALPTIPRGPEPTPLQIAFQPGSTPKHLSHRFMLWNAVGIIQQYNNDEENSIDVAFHDVSIHHPIHITNTLGHTMAALSTEAAAFACPSDEDNPSTLFVMHIASWDSTKEWTIAMPDDEDIEAIAIGVGWLAVATDKRKLRLFSVGGNQREIINLPGPVVALAGHSTQLLITYHKGVGLPGDQNLGVQLFHVTGRKRAVMLGDHMPIAHKSTLAWLGFTAEGTPCAMDSGGQLMLLNRQMSNTWTQVADLKSHCKGKSDNYFIVSVHENPAQIRCILCKGSRYPSALPLPNVAILNFRIPVCDSNSEKGQYEEQYWQKVLLSNHVDFWTSEGYALEEEAKMRVKLPAQELMIKMFALSCKMGREVRACEIAESMPSEHVIQLAIKYAQRLRLPAVLTHLNEILAAKSKEEDNCTQDEAPEYDSPMPAQALKQQTTSKHEESEDVDMENSESLFDGDENDDNENNPNPPKLLLGKKTDADKSVTNVFSSQNAFLKNPFKSASSNPSPTGLRGSSVFDSLSKSTAKKVFSQNKSPEYKRPKGLTKTKKKGPTQAVLPGASKPEEKNTNKRPKRSGFQLWLEENRTSLSDDHPELEEADLTVLAARTFKNLAEEDKKIWLDKAKQPVDSSDDRKRKHVELESSTEENSTVKEETALKKKPLSQSTTNKLANFAFGNS